MILFSLLLKFEMILFCPSISLGWAPVLFPLINDRWEAQHDPVNAGPASKGIECVRTWVGNESVSDPWDVILFNFGLHSLDR